jgi:hypothetical protein
MLAARQAGFQQATSVVRVKMSEASTNSNPLSASWFEPAHGCLLVLGDREYAADAGEHLFKTRYFLLQVICTRLCYFENSDGAAFR